MKRAGLMDEQLIACAQRAIAERVFPGCVIGIVRQNGARAVLPLGNLTYDADAPKVTENTIYDLASITKSIPLASLTLLLIESGRLNLSLLVRDVMPELQNDFDATIEDLMRYRVAGPRMAHLPFQTFEEIRTHILETGFDGPPGESRYTNLPAFLLGLIVERVSGEILPALANKYFFEPLNMHDTTFFSHDTSRIAPTEIIGGKEIRGIVQDESARLFAKRRRAVGHAGLFSTAPNLLNFLEALLHVGHPMSHMCAIVAGAQKGLGWQVNEPWMGEYRSAKTFGKTGFTGTSILSDMEKGIGLVILSNRTYPNRPSDTARINVFREDIANIVTK
ncbi:MAG TPA: serine hydrolase domain-containing protein [Candidatus Paceibacterota bacterium]|nr:serine hydrolase domain-containing protein [Candidatus Paceibacterota bacterium]